MSQMMITVKNGGYVYAYEGTGCTDAQILANSGVQSGLVAMHCKTIKFDGFFQGDYEIFTEKVGCGTGEIVTGMRKKGVYIDIKARAIGSSANEPYVISGGHESLLKTASQNIRLSVMLKKPKLCYTYAKLVDWKFENKKPNDTPIILASYLLLDEWHELTWND